MEADSQRELVATLNYLETLSKQNPEKLKKTLYDSLTAVSYLTLEAKKAKFKNGWAAALVDRHDDPLFDASESEMVESLMKQTIKPIFDSGLQVGGLPLVPSNPASIVQSSIPVLNPEDMSLDRTYVRVKEYLAGLDAQAHTLSRELGPFRFFYESPVDIRIPIPVPPYAIPIPPQAIPVLIGAFVEAVRLLMTLGPLPNTVARKILSVILALIDLLQGQWKNAILSFAGAFGQYPMVIGILGKLALNAFSVISPDLQEKLIYDVFKSSKSFLIGIVLWGFSTLAPDFVRNLVRKQFDLIKDMVKDANIKIKGIQDSMQKSVSPAGLQIKFNEIPESVIPSFDDIQNLQTIANQPEITCSKEFQDIIEPLKAAPPARLLLELFNIPTEASLIAIECGDMAGKSIDSTMDGLLTPKITPIPGSPLATALQIPALPAYPTLPQVPTLPQMKARGGRRDPGTRGKKKNKRTRKQYHKR